MAPEKHVADLKAVWGRELRFLQQNPQAIAHALDHLPEQPPNLVQFKALCVRAPEKAQKELPAPRPDIDRVRQFVAKALASPARTSARDWAVELLQRLGSGERIPIAHVDMAKRALRAYGGES